MPERTFGRNSVRDCIRLHVSLGSKLGPHRRARVAQRDSAYRFGDSDSRVLFRRRSILVTLVLLVITAVGSYASKRTILGTVIRMAGAEGGGAGLAQINALGTVAAFFLLH